MDWLDLPAVQGTLKSLLQHHNSEALFLQCSAFFMVQFSHRYMTTGKTLSLTRWAFVGKVMSLLFNMLSRLVIGEKNGNPLQYSCLQNPRNGGAWWWGCTVSDFILGGSKITADGDCSHEIERHLLLGRKIMTNLDGIFKSREIPLLTKAHLVKAMVFPVVMYGCESWTIKKAEHWRIDAFDPRCWRRL